jgi:hypothetical protein|tara:strand:- start:858 stop:1241 length:384 start_codon:yes stop_codon:yes gene_type:complete
MDRLTDQWYAIADIKTIARKIEDLKVLSEFLYCREYRQQWWWDEREPDFLYKKVDSLMQDMDTIACILWAKFDTKTMNAITENDSEITEWLNDTTIYKDRESTASIANRSDQGNLAQRGASTLDRID